MLGTPFHEYIKTGNPIIHFLQTLFSFGLKEFILGYKMSKGTIVMNKERDVLTQILKPCILCGSKTISD